MNLDITQIKIVSTLAILGPLIFNARIIRTAEVKFRLFFLFLLFGFANDLLGWYYHYYYRPSLDNLLLYASLIYSIVESVFFLWLATDYLPTKKIKNIRGVVLTIIALWSVYILRLREVSVQGDVSHSTLFDAFYHIVVSFFAGFALLKMAEKEDLMTDLPLFWILTGIFFYCFGTFFIFVVKLVVSDVIANHLWIVHDTSNVITYVLYSIGLAMYPKSANPIPNKEG